MMIELGGGTVSIFCGNLPQNICQQMFPVVDDPGSLDIHQRFVQPDAVVKSGFIPEFYPAEGDHRGEGTPGIRTELNKDKRDGLDH